jgi:GTP-binding protein
MTKIRKDIRNVAIIAHVDHGKTTLVDKMLSQSGTIQQKNAIDRVMDSGDMERERGITILAKNTSIKLPNYTINIVDTPGHMDFGGEVERTLQMSDGFILLVDAAEGPLPGTRFVLEKALELDLKALVFINKIDRKDANIEATEEKIQDLFLDVAKKDEHLDFKILYGSSRQGFATADPAKPTEDLSLLFQTIIDEIPAPKAEDDKLRLLITNVDYSDFLGRLGIGRIFSGSMSVGDRVVVCTSKDDFKEGKVIKIFKFDGLTRVEYPTAELGDIVCVAGLGEQISIGSTVCKPDAIDPLNYVAIDQPTLSVNFSVNTSPMAGREGKLLTSRQIRDRLEKELKTNVALRVEDTDTPETFKVSGRGQLHLAVLVEAMRREGFELQLSSPEVIFKQVDGQKYEPFEILVIDVDQQYQGTVMALVGNRRAELVEMIPLDETKIRLEFEIPSRGLLGLRGFFLTDTRGTGMMNSRFSRYKPFAGDIPSRTRGAMCSMENGKVAGYALDNLQERGTLFVQPGDEVYLGMIIGENSRDNDLDVNPIKGKKLTNMRASGSDDMIKLVPPKIMNLEQALDWVDEDELIEVTPNSIRLRKRYLNPSDRKKKR